MLHLDSFLQTLPIMFWGMLGIFSVICVIILCIFVMNRLFKGHK